MRELISTIAYLRSKILYWFIIVLIGIIVITIPAFLCTLSVLLMMTNGWWGFLLGILSLALTVACIISIVELCVEYDIF